MSSLLDKNAFRDFVEDIKEEYNDERENYYETLKVSDVEFLGLY